MVSGSNSMAECNLPKVDVEGSIPFSRSKLMTLILHMYKA